MKGDQRTDCVGSRQRPAVVIVTPALADANNGNWQTARRWAALLRDGCDVRIARQWPDDAGPGSRAPQVMLALHAGRSAASVAAWVARGSPDGLAVVLTGTDLYRDLHSPDRQVRELVQASLHAARRIVVLQDHAPLELPPALRAKTVVLFQSTTTRQHLPKATGRLRAVMVGHLRDEKDPLTLMRAARMIDPSEGIAIAHIGQALDAALGEQARATGVRCPHYRWCGGLPHETTRKRIQRAHLLVHTSRMEGGAHVIMEAVCSGTPVLASRMAGNLGMLGADYGGYFEVGDAAGLTDLLRRARTDADFLEDLTFQCDQRAPLFSPAREKAALQALVEELVAERVGPRRTASPARP